MDDIILEPLKAYTEVYEREFDKNAREYLDGLEKKSGVDVEENRRTVLSYNAELTAQNNSAARLARFSGLRALLIIVSVISFVAAAVAIYLLCTSTSVAAAIILPVGLVLGIGCILLAVLWLNPKIKAEKEACELHADKAEKFKQLGWEQLAPLNSSFDTNVVKQLIEKTVPLLQIDDIFEMRRYDYLKGKYGFGANDDNDCSTLAILSGEILGNPFVVDRELVHSVASCTYTGSLVITWTTTYRDSKGQVRTQFHSQTLLASVTKPAPFYNERTRLIYGNEAAPDLHFTHEPTHIEKLSEEQTKRRVKSGVKKLKRMQDEAMKNGEDNFTQMGNEDFDVLFGALDRDHEVQFRLLFTPLAQKNMLALMRSTSGYGDDFYFRKHGCLNFVSSEHSASWDLDTSYRRYASFDIDAVRSKFLVFNKEYFRALYFELAPLLSIPLYQQHKPKEYIYKELYERNYTDYEAERAVNALGEGIFAHPDTATRTILKTRLERKAGDSDALTVKAYSYRAEERVDYVSVFGGDGNMHAVPVPWTEYIPIERTSTVYLKRLTIDDKEFESRLKGGGLHGALSKYGNYNFCFGMLCAVALNKLDTSFDEDINGALK